MPAKIYSISISGLTPGVVEVEADVSRGLSSFKIVGLGDASVQESKERVRSAIKNSGLTYPIQKKIINLAPAEIKKQGTSLDFPIAASLLIASKQIPQAPFNKSILIGELSLNGDLKPIKGILPVASYAKKKGFKSIFLPLANKSEASLVEGIKIYPITSLKNLTDFAQGKSNINSIRGNLKKISLENEEEQEASFSSIYGLENAKRALTIAAAGNHNTLLKGPQGTGKTILARAFASLLPPLTLDEALEITEIYSVTEGLSSIHRHRPFREVHHTASKIAIIGGGQNLKPGEITMAHKGVLFLDEITEFPRNVLETLRQPLEDKKITISRAKSTHQYPCDFILLAAMNNCPCGNLQPNKKCKCTHSRIKSYQSKLSGPLLDRFDIFIETPTVIMKNIFSPKTNEDKHIKERIQKAHNIQNQRSSMSNSKLSAKQISSLTSVDKKAKEILNKAADKLNISNRGYLKIIRVAQTIADLEGSPTIKEDHVLESIQYRKKA
jgi:magnesium chelatase family protein